MPESKGETKEVEKSLNPVDFLNDFFRGYLDFTVKEMKADSEAKQGNQIIVKIDNDIAILDSPHKHSEKFLALFRKLRQLINWLITFEKEDIIKNASVLNAFLEKIEQLEVHIHAAINHSASGTGVSHHHVTRPLKDAIKKFCDTPIVFNIKNIEILSSGLKKKARLNDTSKLSLLLQNSVIFKKSYLNINLKEATALLSEGAYQTIICRDDTKGEGHFHVCFSIVKFSLDYVYVDDDPRVLSLCVKTTDLGKKSTHIVSVDYHVSEENQNVDVELLRLYSSEGYKGYLGRKHKGTLLENEDIFAEAATDKKSSDFQNKLNALFKEFPFFIVANPKNIPEKSAAKILLSTFRTKIHHFDESDNNRVIAFWIPYCFDYHEILNGMKKRFEDLLTEQGLLSKTSSEAIASLGHSQPDNSTPLRAVLLRSGLKNPLIIQLLEIVCGKLDPNVLCSAPGGVLIHASPISSTTQRSSAAMENKGENQQNKKEELEVEVELLQAQSLCVIS